MADKKISQLTPATTPLAGTETLPIVQGGNTVKTTVQDVANLASSPNPTNTFVPFNNAGTFADSYAVNDTTSEVFKTTHNSSDKGLKLDFANNQYLIGKDFDKATNDYSFIGFKPYSDTVQYILELKDTVEFGNNFVQIYNPEEGYFCTASTNSPAYNTLIQQNNGQITFQVNNVIDDNSSFVAFYAEYLNLQSNYNGGTNVVQFKIDSSNNTIQSISNGDIKGLNLDFGLFSYKFGDFNSTNNGVYFEADDDAGVARIFSGGGYFNFEADAVTTRIGDIGGTNNGTTFGVDDQNGTLSGTTNLLSVSAGAFSGQYLKIKIGTTQYKIALLNNV